MYYNISAVYTSVDKEAIHAVITVFPYTPQPAHVFQPFGPPNLCATVVGIVQTRNAHHFPPMAFTEA